jgi:FkbM family methyltransferase
MSYKLAESVQAILHHGSRPGTGRNGQSKSLVSRVVRTSAYKIASYFPTNCLDWLRGKTLLRDVLDRFSINCVIDVGANQGQYGLSLRGIGYSGQIVSFEPVKSNLDVLRVTAARHEPWKVVPYALGTISGTAEINVTENTVFSSLLEPDDTSRRRFPSNRVERRETIEIRRLDQVLSDYIADIANPNLYLKLDTQGFDLEVFRGAESILPSVLALQTELSFRNIYHSMHDFTESITEFRSQGFEVVDFLPGVRDIDRLSAIEMDCIMVRRPRW